MKKKETTPKKPKVKLVGQDSNVFNLIGICTRALKKEGMNAEAKELTTKCFASGSYHEAMAIMMEYCDVS